MVLRKQDAGAPVAVHAASTVTIAVDEHPTTGFVWTVETLEGAVTLMSSSFAPDPHGRPGAGGERRFEVRADAPGSASLRLRYARRWEPPAATAERLAFVFQIT